MSFKAGYCALLGMPNAGKSTLMNALLGEKVSIVSSKPQTTRRRIHGIWTTEEFQAIFVDAPGLVGKTSKLNEFLHDECLDILHGADSILVLLNLDEDSPDYVDRLVRLAEESRKPWAVVISKSDMPKAHRIQIIKDKLSTYNRPVVVTSALRAVEKCREDMKALLPSLLPDSPAPLYSEELYTTETVSGLSAEIIREKCFENLYQEIPYGLAVQIRQFQENNGKMPRIMADILVEREGHKKIVVGKAGENIKKIGSEARQDIEKLMEGQVYLELHVSVKPGWMKNSNLMKELGYVLKE